MIREEDSKYIKRFIKAALEEDIKDGDHTTLACIPSSQNGKARCLIKQDGVLAGVELAVEIFQIVDPGLEVDIKIEDGTRIKYGDVPFFVSGKKQSILTAERLVLNFMQRMSGISSLTRLFADKIAHTTSKLLDTRKTTPGLRVFEKWAVRIGGGHNHRMGLYDRVMIKDNHVDFCGGIAQAIDTVEKYLKAKNIDIPIEIETRNLAEVAQVLKRGGVDRIMLDNYDLSSMREAVQLINGRFETEGSGGVNLDTIGPIAETGVDYVSVGALTHSATALDISLKAV
ncbi:MAG: nicotinate-nucleotide pyrophosphorylase (carboxylating) [Limisphaerales bacterium]|jgi:nicotinate-nucleotide pyrophosphorylase (carboxylating)